MIKAGPKKIVKSQTATNIIKPSATNVVQAVNRSPVILAPITEIGIIAIGQQGIPGTDGSNVLVKEVPIGEINSINKEFVLSNIPQTLCLFLNGLAQQDFSVSGTIVTLPDAPLPDDQLLALYSY